MSGRLRLAVKPLEILTSKRSIQPHICQLFLDAVCAQAFVEVFEIDEIEMLVLVKAGEDKKLFAGVWIDMALQTLRTDLFHHALHRRIDRTDSGVTLIQIRFK